MPERKIADLTNDRNGYGCVSKLKDNLELKRFIQKIIADGGGRIVNGGIVAAYVSLFSCASGKGEGYDHLLCELQTADWVTDSDLDEKVGAKSVARVYKPVTAPAKNPSMDMAIFNGQAVCALIGPYRTWVASFYLKLGNLAGFAQRGLPDDDSVGMSLGQVGVSLYEYVRASPHAIGDIAETFYLRTTSEAAGGNQSDVLPLFLPIVPEEGTTNQSKGSDTQSKVNPRSLKSWIWLVVLPLNVTSYWRTFVYTC